MEKTFTLEKYLTSVKRLIESKIPPIWVHGVVTQLQVRGRMVYISIAQYQEGSERPVASLNCYMFARDYEQMNKRLLGLASPFAIEVDLKVNLLLKADFYTPMGKFQPQVIDIDENYTLGEMAQTRQAILQRLEAEGLLQKNRNRTLIETPLSIGLITAPDSAAHRDFMNVLNQSPFAFQVHLIEARMQGLETEKSIVKGLANLNDLKVDVICIIRGGGAKTDLVYFDSEEVCRQIANSNIPVLTGIGHQIDTSLADLVAWENFITPTDCATFLADRLNQALQNLQSLSSQIASLVSQKWMMANERIAHMQFAFDKSSQSAIQRERSKLALFKEKLPQRWKTLSFLEKDRLSKNQNALLSATSMRWQKEKERLRLNQNGFAKGSEKLLFAQNQMLSQRSLRLQSLMQYRLSEAQEKLKSLKSKVSDRNPKRILKRGYTLTRTVSGSLAKFDTISEGDILITETSLGYIESTVKKVKKE